MKKIEGRCHCGDCSYSLLSEKQFEFLCHCSDCKVINSGGHLSGVTFTEEGFSIEGNLSVYTYPGGSGKNIEYSFCQKCGTGLFARPRAHDGIIVIRANTLDDGTLFNPQKSLFAEGAHLWDKSTIK